MKSLVLIFFMGGFHFNAFADAKDRKKSQTRKSFKDECIHCNQLKKAWEGFRKAAKAKDQAMGAFINSLTVAEKEGKYIFAPSNPKTLSQLESAETVFNSTEQTLKSARKKYKEKEKRSSLAINQMFFASDNGVVDKYVPSNQRAIFKTALKNMATVESHYQHFLNNYFTAANGWMVMQDSYFESQKQVEKAKEDVSHYLYLKHRDREFMRKAGPAMRKLKAARDRSQSSFNFVTFAQKNWIRFLSQKKENQQKICVAIIRYNHIFNTLPEKSQKALPYDRLGPPDFC